MASLTSVLQFQTFLMKPRSINAECYLLCSSFLPFRSQSYKITRNMNQKSGVVVMSATTAEKPRKRYPGEAKGFVEEMRFVAMKLHSKEQAKEGEKEVKKPGERPVAKWEPTVDGYLRFLVDSKLVYDSQEGIIEKAVFPSYTEFRNTGLERSEKLAKDLEWFKEQGYAIPEPSSPGITYAQYLKELSEKDPQAFICHFYNIYFAHSAGGRMIGKQVAEKILDKKDLEFYKWDGDLSRLLQNVRDKLNKVTKIFSSMRQSGAFHYALGLFAENTFTMGTQKYMVVSIVLQLLFLLTTFGITIGICVLRSTLPPLFLNF